MDDRPPPPPHGAPPNSNGRASGLPPGNYDIFVIPPHSAGSGFLYLPSLQPHRNSFLAGVVCTLASVGIWTVVAPIVEEWFSTVVLSGGAGVVVLILGVGVLGWAMGRTQTESEHKKDNRPPDPEGTGAGDSSKSGSQGSNDTHPNGGPQANGGPYTRPGPQGFTSGFTPGPNPGPTPKPSWQQQSGTGTASSSWERAREETKKREEERRRKEDLEKRRQEAEKKRQEAEKKAKEAAEKEKWEKARAREREAREKEAREKIVQERLQKEKEAKDREIRLEAEARAIEREREREREREKEREKEKEQEKEREREREREARERERAKAANPAKTAAAAAGSANYKRPTAQSFAGDDEYSFRPYDKPSKPKHHGSQSSFVSDTASSWAESQSTARTTPPPSVRGPFSTKDPEKIQIKAVYEFTDGLTKPVRQLVSGVGNVTDGLILNMTTEGIFIDDVVRGVGQREWDVKAWTLKLVEVWCAQFAAHCGPVTPARYALKQKEPGQKFMSNANGKALTASEVDGVVADLLLVCKSSCPGQTRSNHSSNSQTGDSKGLHVLRACIRDAENRKYVFIIDNGEAWKVAVGLQRLRRGTQVRSLGVSGLPASETSRLLGTLGWA